MEPSPIDRLDSWKDIAAFLARDERTAMRWAKYLAMPVHHAPGGKHARVYAFRSEIAAWMTMWSDKDVSPQHFSPHLGGTAAASDSSAPHLFLADASHAPVTAPPFRLSLLSRLWKHFTPFLPRTRHAKSDAIPRDSHHM
jgi:hypothetical protein